MMLFSIALYYSDTHIISHCMSNFIPQDPLILPLVIVEPFGGASADLVVGMGRLAEELNVRVQVNY